jgi:hypothetical protein
MSNYDRLIDSITDTIYDWYVAGQRDCEFPEDLAKRDAHKILEMVEKFQSTHDKVTQWRATD